MEVVRRYQQILGVTKMENLYRIFLERTMAMGYNEGQRLRGMKEIVRMDIIAKLAEELDIRVQQAEAA